MRTMPASNASRIKYSCRALRLRYSIFLIICVLLVHSGLVYAQRSGDVSNKKKVIIGMIGKIADNPVFVAFYSGLDWRQKN